jgi:CDP-glycerol glycerophosphotransferase (TagB/SpsB family)
MITEMPKIKKILSSLGISNYNIKESSELALPYLLSFMDLHITAYSSVVLEAANYKIPSLCFDQKAKLLFKKEIKSKIVFFLDETSDISDQIQKLVRIKNLVQEATDSKVENLDDTLRNFLQFIEKANRYEKMDNRTLKQNDDK